jgi:hypothetical protein
VGSFYTNITLRGPSQQAVAAELSGRRAFVTPIKDGCVVVFDEESEEQDPDVLSGLAAKLSARLACPALAVLNHDDDVLLCMLFEKGAKRDTYDSTPGFDGGDPFAPPKGGDASALCAAFGSSRVADVSRILRATRDTYMFAVMRHADLVAALGLPDWSVGAGFNYVVQGEPPAGLDESSLMKTT